MAKRRIFIPKGVKCPDCGGTDLTGRGTDWRTNPHGNNPTRVLVQLLRCKGCGLIFADGEVKKEV